MKSDRFTFILDFDGGTYVSQAEGSLQDACNSWATNVAAFDKDGTLEFLESVSLDEPTAVKGLANVWCLSGLVSEKLALVHIVKTDNETIQNPKSEIQNR